MTTSQKSQERHQTSVFSQYENNSNNSISSKQLQLWLQQMAPTTHTSPKFGQDWNLMSTSSRYESDGLTFGARMETFESANKQNILSKANFIIEPSKSTNKENHYQSFSHQQNFEKLKSSKSYINAMQELQKRAKTLEQDNLNMRKSLQILQQEKRNSLQSSMVESEQMRSKILKFQETEKRIEEMKKENKKLRDSKNEQSLKIKLMQKSINDQKVKVKMFEQRLEMLSKENEDLKRQLNQSSNLMKSLMMENKQLAMKTETLENMKEKSTNSILEKYAKALERIQELELNIGELKTKGNLMQEKYKKSIQDKDGKYWSSLQTINQLKSEKEQFSIRFLNSNNELEQKSKYISQLQENLRLFEHELSEQNKQILTFRNVLSLKNEKLTKMGQKYTNIKKKCTQIQHKIILEQQKQIDHMKSAKQIIPQIQNHGYESESEESIDQQNLIEISQQNVTNLSDFAQEKNQQCVEEDTPVERYDQTSPGNENMELEQFTTLAKPLSIIVNARNSQARIKSEEEQFQVEKNNSKLEESQEDEDSLINQRYISLKQQEYLSEKENVLKAKKQTNRKSISLKGSKYQKENQSKSKDSVKSTQSRKKSLQESKYIIPASSFNRKKKPTTIMVNNSSLSSHNRSKSSSIEKKKTTQKKSVSVDSKRNSIYRQKISNENQIENQNHMIKSTEPCQSRYINEKPQQVYMYMSAQPTRYPSQHPEHYYYSNQINAKKNYDEKKIAIHEPFYQQNDSSHGNLMMGRSESQAKKALNKALLLEYQEEALKLYEEHEKLLAMSEDQNISTQEKAEILGRTRQVMSMIDHNTQKIFNLKGRSE